MMKKTTARPGMLLAAGVLIVLLVGIAIYSNTFRAQFQFDDLKEITENFKLRQLSNLHLFWETLDTRFLTYLTFIANYQLHRTDVTGYHVVNLLIHLSVSLLVLLLVKLLFKTPAMKSHPLAAQSDMLAIASALLFVAHPIQTQAVTYIIQRLASFATLFYTGALVLYLKWRLENKASYYVAACFVTFAAMFTKEITVTLPVAILLCEGFFFGGFRAAFGKNLPRLLPFLLALAVIPFFYFHRSSGVMDSLYSAGKETALISRSDYLLTQINVIRTYLRLLVLPVGQNVDYDYPVSHSFFELRTGASFLLIAVILAAAVWLYRRQRMISFGIFWFFLTLSVESSILPIRDVIFEHRLYLPMVGFAIALPQAIFLILRDGKRFQAVFCVIILAFSVATFRRNAVWQNGIALWQDAINKSPHKTRPYQNLAVSHNERGEFAQAIAACQEALRIDPKDAGCFVTTGLAYSRSGDIDKSIEFYEKAEALRPPNLPKIYNNLGTAYGNKKNYVKAIEYFQKGIAAAPDYPPSYNNLGYAYDQTGDYDKAVEYFKKALELDPDFAEAYNHWGITLGKKGDYQKTIEYCSRAVRLKPDYADAYNNIGVSYYRLGNSDEAIASYQKAIRADPKYALAYLNLIKSYAERGDTENAQKYSAELMKVHPGIVRAMTRQSTDAGATV